MTKLYMFPTYYQNYRPIDIMLTKQEKLAREIATALNDMHAYKMHLSFVNKYSEAYLREKLNRVMSMPDEKIRTTRARLYTSLVMQYDS